ncbi:MAG TPA: sigma-70 family RNA polymerase sigma factor [Candidatus Parabacteroides intestinigallinarum]|uniref:Sigma-70 family RNA polymerase sigma factor n=1 Tax=Candidatus Parabacteroides intestinigallinarum TaxID=2838722 RepID=A0A9D2BQE5_9BACT|nr:sigma-70 family RNA polymerase sigma factor [Candidatus Parabacteroides intestinigallinarum]
MNEQQLIEGCRKGDRRAQKELYDTYSRKMMGVCLRYVDDRETARDLLQDGFVKVFTGLDSYAGSGSFEGWMRRIFVNCALEYLRRSDVLREATDLENTAELIHPDSSAISDLSAAELMRLVSELPTGFRTVFNMFAIEGYSHKEIGEMLGITESTSRSQYTRAKQLLQRRINALY